MFAYNIKKRIKMSEYQVIGVKPISDNVYRVVFTNWRGGHVDGRLCQIGEIYTKEKLEAIKRCKVEILTLLNGEK
jgi:hypothetical protein